MKVKSASVLPPPAAAAVLSVPIENRPRGMKSSGRKKTWPPLKANTTSAMAIPMACAARCSSPAGVPAAWRRTVTPSVLRARFRLPVAADRLVGVARARQVVAR